MIVVPTKDAFRVARARVATLGFVPTMGFLHDGHLSLVRAAKEACGTVAVSIFVNPTQFAPTEDLARYPRDLDRDLALLRAADTDLVFVPDAAEMYPPGFDARIELGGLTTRLEGAVRPGHFAGVATVVAKLLNIVQPNAAWFGQKDAQQVAVIRKLVRDLDLPVTIEIGATVREPDGLALSSRNVYLSPEARAAAAVLYRALTAADRAFRAGERAGEILRGIMREVLATEPSGVPDYVSVADADSFAELETVPESGALASLAVRFGATRLIDNIMLGR